VAVSPVNLTFACKALGAFAARNDIGIFKNYWGRALEGRLIQNLVGPSHGKSSGMRNGLDAVRRQLSTNR
jgi:hypothetical protein